MSLDQRREREKQDRRDSILDAAETIFFSKGFEKCSMGEIAQQAQLSRALLYVYFKDRTAILHGIMLRAGESLRAQLQRALQTSDLGVEQIESIGLAYYRFSIEQPNYFDVLTQANGLSHLPEADQQIHALRQCSTDAMQLMEQALRRGIEDGSLNPERLTEPLKTAYYLRGALHGVIMQCRDINDLKQPGHPDPAELVSYTLSMLTHSIRV